MSSRIKQDVATTKQTTRPINLNNVSSHAAAAAAAAQISSFVVLVLKRQIRHAHEYAKLKYEYVSVIYD